MSVNIAVLEAFMRIIKNTNYSDKFLEEICELIDENEQAFRAEIRKCGWDGMDMNQDLENLLRNFRWNVDKLNYINLGYAKMPKIRKEFPIITKIMGWKNREIILPKDRIAKLLE